MDKCLEFFEENGDSEGAVILKSDQEPAMELLLKEMVEARPGGRTIVEGSLEQSTGSNGIVERAAQEIEGGMRSLFLGVGGTFGTPCGRLGKDCSFYAGICVLCAKPFECWAGWVGGL